MRFSHPQKNTPIYNLGAGLCLSVPGTAIRGTEVGLSICSSDHHDKIAWDFVTPVLMPPS